MTSDTSDRDSSLATLLHLNRRCRESDSAAELRFLLVNETLTLLPYRQAAFWSSTQGVETLSGVTQIEPHAPYVIWLNQWFRQAPSSDRVRAFTTDLRILAKDDIDWSEWLPPYVANLYIPPKENHPGGYLLLAREEAFTQPELALLEAWGDAWADRYRQLSQTRWHRKVRNLFGNSRRGWLYRLGALIVFAAICLFPVHLSVLAPAELIPLKPAIIRAPMDGIVDRVLVTPNQRVTQGDALFEFDRVSLNSRLEVARRALATVQAEYRQQAQRALFDSESKARLAVLQSQIEEKQVEVAYLEKLNLRSTVTSPQDGLVLLNDAQEWVGRPVATGERVLMVADETRSQVEAWLAPADMIRLEPHADLNLYLSADPLLPLHAKVSYIAHQPELRPDNQYAYRIRAQLQADKSAPPRVGLKGTARIEGERVSLIYWVLRRPWAAFRGWAGI